MKPATRVRLKTAGFILFAALSLIGSGPAVFHLAYRAATSDSKRQEMTERYTLLANTEALDKTIDEVTKRQIQAERTTIFYWFHARGWPIDEDAESRGFFHRWSELISYWKS